ncbi:MAG TPA: M23 family metallopeptidase [Candidatus Eisenbacteria bacterium]|nr:M23 family metallopeptidase [Candidatus Eisenbacteria bacterium]
MAQTRGGPTGLAIVASAIVAHWLLPLSLLLRLWVERGAHLGAWLATIFFLGAYLVFLHIAGTWSWFGFRFRTILPLVFVATAAGTWPGWHAGAPAPAVDDWMPLFQWGLGGVFVWLALRAWQGRRAPEFALQLAFPLRGGTFVVGQGGGSAVINHHYPHRSQRFALDILALSAAGVRARGLYPRDPERYAIWGAEVVSPCDGTVVAVADEFPDYTPPNRDPANPPGNHVAIETENAVVYLAHLMQGSVRVRVGEPVRAGQPLGLVGNSGNTTEPHLHIHAESGHYSGRMSGGAGVPILLGGRFLVRNDRVAAPIESSLGEAS